MTGGDQFLFAMLAAMALDELSAIRELVGVQRLAELREASEAVQFAYQVLLKRIQDLHSFAFKAWAQASVLEWIARTQNVLAERRDRFMAERRQFARETLGYAEILRQHGVVPQAERDLVPEDYRKLLGDAKG